MDGFGTTPRFAGGDDRVKELLMACIDAARVDGAGMSLVSDGVREPVFGSDVTARTLEQLQFTLGEGPCVDATTSGAPVLVSRLDQTDWLCRRWPAFVDEAVRSGAHAVFAFPVQVGAVALAVVSLYRREPGPMHRQELAKVLSVMDALVLALLGDGGATTLDMEAFSDFVVHRAAGMVMVQTGSSIEQALMRMRAAAYSDGIPIELLAKNVVDGVRRFGRNNDE